MLENTKQLHFLCVCALGVFVFKEAQSKAQLNRNRDYTVYNCQYPFLTSVYIRWFTWYTGICSISVFRLFNMTPLWKGFFNPIVETTTKLSGGSVPPKHVALLAKQWWRAWWLLPWPELPCMCISLTSQMGTVCPWVHPFSPGSRHSCINLSALMIGRVMRGDAQWQGPPRFIRPPKDQIHTA